MVITKKSSHEICAEHSLKDGSTVYIRGTSKGTTFGYAAPELKKYEIDLKMADLETGLEIPGGNSKYSAYATLLDDILRGKQCLDNEETEVALLMGLADTLVENANSFAFTPQDIKRLHAEAEKIREYADNINNRTMCSMC